MRKRLLNILASVAVLTSVAMLSACQEDGMETASPYLNGSDKTPIETVALLGVENVPQTRAADKTFAENDKFVAYIRQVKWDGSTGGRTLVNAQKSPSLITFTKGNTPMTAYSGSDITPIGMTTSLGLSNSNTQETSDLTVDGGLYWDDFSVNDAEKDNTDNSTNLRDTGHYLQSYYGYCYNGSPAIGESGSCIYTSLNEATGELGWTVQTDQSADGAFQHSDLLWSAEQTPIAYSHATFNGGTEHGKLVLPFTHAMSKVTINLIARNGFADNFKFTSTEVSLNNKNTVCTTTAPNMTLVASTEESTIKDIKMFGGSSETVKQRSYSAIMVPSTLTSGETFATVTGVDGNKYEIKVTNAMLQKGTEHEGKGWGDKLTQSESNYTTQSGVHYVLNVTIDKQQITVSALLKDWDEVSAVGDGEIRFDNDITATGNLDIDILKTNGFDVYKDNTNSSTSFASKNTTLTWNTTDSKWGYDPAIYWTGQSDASYFRALSPKATTKDMTEDTDVLWGYACDKDDDKAKVGTSEEVKITPRTGDVPLHFEHPMSKISVILKTDKDASGTDIPTDAQVNLTGAKISIINLYDKGTLNMADGSIGSLSTSDKAPFTIKDQVVNSEYKRLDNIVIPQSLVNDKEDNPRTTVPTFKDNGEIDNQGDRIMLYVTLADGTRYRVDLSTCKVTDTDGNATDDCVTKWQRGKHYTYTISLSKEQITFRAMIKDWEETHGSGNATLDWD